MILNIFLEELVVARDSDGKVLNPRGSNFTSTDLQESMKISGQHDEVKVVQLAEGEFLLLDGHRRLQAATALGWKSLRATVEDIGQVSDATILERMLAADLKQPFKPSQLALGMKRLMLHKKWPLERVAALRGLKVDKARLYLDLLSAPESVQQRVDSGEMSLSAFETLRNQPQSVQEAAAALPAPTKAAVRSTIRKEAGRAASVGQMVDLLSQTDAAQHTLIQALREASHAIQRGWYQMLPHEQEAVALILSDLREYVEAEEVETDGTIN